MVSQRWAVGLRSVATALLCLLVASGSIGRAVVDAAGGPTATEVNIYIFFSVGNDGLCLWQVVGGQHLLRC